MYKTINVSGLKRGQRHKRVSDYPNYDSDFLLVIYDRWSWIIKLHFALCIHSDRNIS
jgi:hypothetical protein